MDLVFLDANVLFSAAYDPRCRIRELWDIPDVQLVTSAYAAAEAIRNISPKCPPGRLGQLDSLLQRVKIVAAALLDGTENFGPPPDDRPILAAAIACGATYLLTGDRDFRRLFGRVVMGVMVLRPGDFLLLSRNTQR